MKHLETNVPQVYLDWFCQDQHLRAGTAPQNQTRSHKRQKIDSKINKDKPIEFQPLGFSPKKQNSKPSISNSTQQLFRPKQFFSQIINENILEKKSVNAKKMKKSIQSNIFNPDKVVKKMYSKETLQLKIENPLQTPMPSNRPQTTVGATRCQKIKFLNKEDKKLPDLKLTSVSSSMQLKNLPIKNECKNIQQLLQLHKTSKNQKTNAPFFKVNFYKNQRKQSDQIKNDFLLESLDEQDINIQNNPHIDDSDKEDFCSIIMNSSLQKISRQDTQKTFQFQSNLDQNFLNLFANDF